jgi:hypothetical protein
MMVAFELMKINPGAGKIFFALVIMATAVLLAFFYLYLMKRTPINGNRDNFREKEF